jgi:hypothetical protein
VSCVPLKLPVTNDGVRDSCVHQDSISDTHRTAVEALRWSEIPNQRS